MSMNRYELLYIIPTSFTDDEVGTIENKVSALLTKYQATVESTRRLGKFRLAYAINHQRHGHYVMVIFTAEPAAMAKIDENLRIMTEPLRHLITRLEEEGEQKFDLVQFVEVNVDNKEDRRRKSDKKDGEGKDGEVKEGESKEGEAKEEKSEGEASEEKAKEEKSA